jgi:hypothetical protein
MFPHHKIHKHTWTSPERKTQSDWSLLETWSSVLREEHRLKVFENRMLRSIFGPKRDEETGGWRKLHNEELHNLYISPNIIRVVK